MTVLDPKAALHHYLQDARDALLWKLDGLSERDARMPRTPTGTNLLGIVKHCLNVEVAYFGPTFGREWPTPEELVAEADFETDLQADWYATEDESLDGMVDLYRRVWAFGDETINAMPLDARGRVPHWQPERNEVTLQQITLHVIGDLARHAGHADILREGIDGHVGMVQRADNIPHETDWPTYVAKLKQLADRF